MAPGNSDLCFEWDGPIDAAVAHLLACDVEIELGPVARKGAKGDGTSVYFRDPDGSLMEFISYAAEPRRGASLPSPGRARPRRSHRRPPVPPRAAVDQRRAAADGPAARPPGAGRVLGLLPGQLDAHAALPAGLARALRGRRAARDRRARRGLPALGRTPTRCATPSRGSRSPTRSWSTSELEIWQEYGNLGWPARYLFDQEQQAVRVPLRRGRLRRDRARDPGAARRRASRCSSRSGPRTPPARCCRPDRRRRGPVLGALRGRRRVGGAGRRRDSSMANGARIEVDHPGCYELISHPAQHRRRARARGRRRASPATPSASRPGWRSRELVEPTTPSSRFDSRGGPSSSTTTREPGAVRARATGRCRRERGLVDPAAAVDQLRAGRRAPLAGGRRRAAGRRGGCGRRSRVGASTPSRAARRRAPAARRAAARAPRCRRAAGPGRRG